MEEMPPFESCDEFIKNESGEKSAFSFSKMPISTLQFTGPEGLKWEDFERLCCRLMARLYNLHGCRRYSSGRNQEGIDIYGYRTISRDSLVVIQCKRHVDLIYQHLIKLSTNSSVAGFRVKLLNSLF